MISHDKTGVVKSYRFEQLKCETFLVSIAEKMSDI